MAVKVRTMLTARLHPHSVRGRDGYRYSVLFAGKLLVGSVRVTLSAMRRVRCWAGASMAS